MTEIGRLVSERRQGLTPVGDRLHLKRRAQQSRDVPSHVGVVVGNEHADALRIEARDRRRHIVLAGQPMERLLDERGTRERRTWHRRLRKHTIGRKVGRFHASGSR